ncbi:MAG: hypothetical protein LBR26_13160 [Prevotella sp.]|jgi:DNA-binding IclR family transcriptional regulator|nr:hypothetical protein [Prevotella sp.]
MDKNQDLSILKAIALLEGRGTVAKTFLMENLGIGHNRADRLLGELGRLGYIDYQEGYQSHFINPNRNFAE